ncbi:MAG: WG repeat-containing protein [Bacteroidetes bacterium]|nr:WG repeat-containing protein [Bacteroidota bacterium]MCB0845777.1 WG repeat-containing protein [Bacteroidota bacterium]
MRQSQQNLLLLIPVLLFLASCGNLVSDQQESYWPIKEGSLYGFISSGGDRIIAPQFAYGVKFSEGLAAVNVGGTQTGIDIPTDGKWGFINLYGQYVINPKYFSPPNGGYPFDLNSLSLTMHQAYEFSEGLAAVRTESEWIYIDTAERVIIRNSEIKCPRKFSEGLAAVYINGKWGYIDKGGNQVIEPQFVLPADFHEGHARVMDEDGRWVVLNKKGQRILPQYRIESDFNEGLAVVQANFKQGEARYSSEFKYGLVDTLGRLLFEPQFDQIGRYGSGLAPVLVGSKGGENIPYYEQTRADSHIGGKWGFVDQRGQFIINPVFEDAKGFSEGIAAVKMGGLWGYMDAGGNMITGYEFRWVGYFHEGIAYVKLGPAHNDYDYRYAYIDRSGDVLWIEP